VQKVQIPFPVNHSLLKKSSFQELGISNSNLSTGLNLGLPVLPRKARTITSDEHEKLAIDLTCMIQPIPESESIPPREKTTPEIRKCKSKTRSPSSARSRKRTATDTEPLKKLRNSQPPVHADINKEKRKLIKLN